MRCRGMLVVCGVLLCLGGGAQAAGLHSDPAPVRHLLQRIAAHPGDAARLERLQRVGKRVIAVAARHCRAGRQRCLPRLRLEEGRGLNAHARTGVITVTRALVDLAASDDELALVIAHEHAHLLLGHAELSAMSAHGGAVHAEEHAADRLGLQVVAAAGFQPRRAIELWPRMAEAQPKLRAGGAAHPALAERYAALQATCDAIDGRAGH